MADQNPKTLRLILGDQLNHKHSWYNGDQDHIVYFMAEMRQETDYVKHHIQKVVAFFMAMRGFKEWMDDRGFENVYYQLDHKDNQQDLVDNLNALIEKHSIEKFEYLAPDEWRLDQQLKDFCESLEIEWQGYDTEHFLTKRMDVKKFFEGKKRLTMEYFYRDMRKKYDIMIEGDKEPEGGKWNYDQSNRKKWDEKTPIPHERGFRKDVSEIIELLEKEGVATFGRIDETNFNWPTTRQDALDVLNYFCENLLEHFGDFQDAMHTDQDYLFHSRLSFAMNSKLLSPMEVIETAVDRFRESEKTNNPIHISQIEGFIRQILGWREFMRGIYWKEMPDYQHRNELENRNKLPDFYWTGETKMNCLKHSINNSLDNAYAHHIQRLMITGNYALLTMTDPNYVDEWYLGVYIDAIEWVEITNTRGMSQWADGGLVATKPYVSSGSYINKMSNYCKGCAYQVNKKKAEDDACPFNSLYWHFLDEKEVHFSNNQRMNMMMALLKKMDPDLLKAHKNKAEKVINSPEDY
ncbi:cryptochrome/photolyase family protein [Nonlabens marinus]|uniref:Protein related to deoxyribodipyrimidine photolyase n=1 Tax=Nonlabens marinus S1-08 TaxID=1454201 RepID=W8VRK6_9FLAO|nr:cryptochrome/photolyase family protein [Nonlabens marinus]BAO55675.1 protein related to deoxyribodipyrimidine photolyase [Nonlabens marinus S1-08]